MTTELQARAWCWFECVDYRPDARCQLWRRYFREFRWMRDHNRREAEMFALSA